jgi:hypothetical protein
MSVTGMAETTNQELENEYLEWVDHYLSTHTKSTRIEHSRIVLRHLLRGAGSTLSFFPRTPYRFSQFHERYLFHGDARENDWYNVGADLYRAILEHRIANCDRARHPREIQPTDPIPGR